MTTITVAPHPSLLPAAFLTRLPHPLANVQTPAAVLALLSLDARAPFQRDEGVRAAVRDMLRAGGYKPTGRGKPASEYLVRAAEEGGLNSINAVVDVCNAVSLHSGLPISVVDTSRAEGPYRIAIAAAGTRYVFNASGQEIDVSGLLCLFDAQGPCANAVKDSQRTKTNDATESTLSVVWGVSSDPDLLAAAATWYRALLHDCGAVTEDVVIDQA